MELKTKYPVVFLNSEEILLPLKELVSRAKEQILKTGAEKVNIIAWSRWGLAARILACEMPEKIASVSTVCTPHRGLRAAEGFMGRLAVKCWARLAGKTKELDAAVKTMSPAFMREFNEKYPQVRGVFCQSAACAMKPGDDEKLASANNIISITDGENDGVVSLYSALWGQHGRVYRGVSHLGVTDEIYGDLIAVLMEYEL